LIAILIHPINLRVGPQDSTVPLADPKPPASGSADLRALSTARTHRRSALRIFANEPMETTMFMSPGACLAASRNAYQVSLTKKQVDGNLVMPGIRPEEF